MVSACARRQRIAYVCQRGRSVRRACALLSVARSTVGYESKLVQWDAPAVAVMRELAAQYPRYGYRRIQVFLGHRGHAMSTDRAHRLWRLHKEAQWRRLRRPTQDRAPRTHAMAGRASRCTSIPSPFTLPFRLLKDGGYMVKQICFFRQRPDMAFEQFMDYYEN
jgi:hypothetical protein